MTISMVKSNAGKEKTKIFFTTFQAREKKYCSLLVD